MKFNIAAAAITGGVCAVIAIGGTGLVNMVVEGYGEPFLQMMASVYPGYDASGSVGDLVIGCIYGAIDGMIGCAVLAWLYNYASFLTKKA
jgi:hypothetical protein